MTKAMRVPSPQSKRFARTVTTVATVLATLAGVALGQSGEFEGVRLNIAMLQWPPTEIVSELTPAFEEATGIDVVYEVMPWVPAYEKISLELATGSSTYDVITIDNTWAGEFVSGGHLLALPHEKWQADPAFEYDDILASYLEAYGAPMVEPGELYVFPFATDVPLLLYRSDLFDDAENQQAFEARFGRPLAPPETWEEYRQVAEFFTQDRDGDGNVDLYGTTIMAGRGFPITSDFTIQLYGRGGYLVDPDTLEPTFNSEIGVEAMQFYADLYEDGLVSEGTLNWAYDEALAAMQLDRAAMTLLWATFWPALQDPEQSEVVGKVGAAPMPYGGTLDASRPTLGGWGIAIPRYSRNQEAALAYVEWFLSPEVQVAYALRGGTSGRISALTSDEVVEANPHFVAMAESAQNGFPFLKPMIPEYSRIQDILGQRLQDVLLGTATVQEALDSSAEQVRSFLQETGYYDE